MLTFTKHTQRSADHTKESKMNEFETDRLNDEALDDEVLNGEALEEVSGGTAQAAVRVKDITPIWVKVSASPLYCRYTPGGKLPRSTKRDIVSKLTVSLLMATGTDS